MPKPGKVFLVGAGPGDPGLLTIRGRDCISIADVIVYDHLANRSFLDLARKDAEAIYVGKQGGDHTMGQDEINALIVRKALGGKTVVRLKGGDPFIFGRGGEEALELARAGVPFEIVPGVTSAISVPAYAGIPLTHRDYTATVAFVTGHEDPLKEASGISWDKLATGIGTLVFLMGVGNLSHIADSLMIHGRAPDTPVAVIRRGTTPEQETWVGTLETISRIAGDNRIRPPAIIVVGDVVRLRGDLNWFETRPLFGRKIVVTRAREQASEFRYMLEALGAEVIEFPTIEVRPPESWGPLDRAIQSLSQYDWLVFTSVNGVRFFLDRLRHSGKDVRDLKGIRIGVIGPKTAEPWERLGIRPDLMPNEYRAEAVVAAFEACGIQGKRILIPRAVEAREVLPEDLRKGGAHVDVVPAYRTVSPDRDTGRVKGLLEEGVVDMVTFTSSSTVLNFTKMFTADGDRLKGWMRRVAVACIGPVTAKTAEEKGFRPCVVPASYTIEALVESIVSYFGEKPSSSFPGHRNPNAET